MPSMKPPARRSAPPPPKIETMRRASKQFSRPKLSISMHKVNSIVPPAILEATAAAKVVVVAEDDAAIRRLLVRALRTLYTVYEATDGEEAMRILEGAPQVDCALLDVMMPKVSGMSVAKAMRASAKLRNVPIIFVTGAATQSEVVEGISVGARYLLRKPFKVKDLLEKVEKVVDKG